MLLILNAYKIILHHNLVYKIIIRFRLESNEVRKFNCMRKYPQDLHSIKIYK